jgi:multidrug resistance protein MdtO
MAQPALEEVPLGPWLREQLAIEPGRLEFAAKLAAVSALTAGLAVFYRTPEPAVAAYLGFFVCARDRTTSVLMALILTLAVGAVLLIALLTARLVLDYPAWRFAAMAALSFGFLFLASASKLRPLAGIFGLLVGYALDKLGGIQIGEEGTRGLLYGWQFVAMPAAVSVALNILLGAQPRRMAASDLARRLKAAADALSDPTEARLSSVRSALADGGGEIRNHLGLARKALGARPDDLSRLDQSVSSMLEILAAVAMLARCERMPTHVSEPVVLALRQMADIVGRGGYPVEIELADATWPGASPMAMEAMTALRSSITEFAEAPPAEDLSHPPAGAGFFAADAFNNPGHMQFAFKISVAAMGCYLLYSLLDWPGIHTCFLTCYIVGLGTAAESIEKLALRLSGAAVGAVIGIGTLLFVMPHVISIGGLLLLLGLGLLLSGYVAAGSPRISYVGFQMAFAFLLCTVQGRAPAFDMKTVRDRVIGILIGNVAVYVVATRVWPTSVTGRVDRAIGAALKSLAAALQALPHGRRPVLATAVYAQLTGIRSDLALARYEPRYLRAPSRWLEARATSVEAISDIQTASLLQQNVDARSRIPERLEALAEWLSGATPIGGVTSPARPHPERLADVIAQATGRLEAALAENIEEPSHAPN